MQNAIRSKALYNTDIAGDSRHIEQQRRKQIFHSEMFDQKNRRHVNSKDINVWQGKTHG